MTNIAIILQQVLGMKAEAEEDSDPGEKIQLFKELPFVKKIVKKCEDSTKLFCPLHLSEAAAKFGQMYFLNLVICIYQISQL